MKYLITVLIASLMNTAITFEQARSLAIKQFETDLKSHYDCGLAEEYTQDFPRYWIFVFQSKEYIKTKKDGSMIPGLPRYLVEKADGKITKIGCSTSTQYFLSFFDNKYSKEAKKIIGSWKMEKFTQGKDGVQYNLKKVSKLSESEEGYVFNENHGYLKQGCGTQNPEKGSWRYVEKKDLVELTHQHINNIRVNIYDNKMTLVWSKIDN